MPQSSDAQYRPMLFSLRTKAGRSKVAALRSTPGITVVDELDSYLDELYSVRHPESIRIGVKQSDREAFVAGIAGPAHARDDFGVWAYFPWNRTLLHVLPEDLHTELRTSRNRNLITETEQNTYYHSHIGVAGLSVGNAVVASLVHTGGAKHLRIADPDILSGSNINRIRAGFDAVGMPKCALVAREVYAVNPFADLFVYEEGITRANLRQFLGNPQPLDVAIDEMDSLYLKIQLRIEARKLGIPVIMAADNGDGVVVDIERFDRDRRLPLMHGQVPEEELLAITADTPRPIAARIISGWVRPENIADRMKDSLLELGKTLYTWPQLGNAAFMAGALLSYVARKIVLNEPVAEGKVVVNPDRWFVPGYDSQEAAQTRQQKTIAFIRVMDRS